MARIIEIPELITVGALAETLELPVTKLIGELFKNGIMATVNEKIDFDTASILVGDLELEVELKQQEKKDEIIRREINFSDKATERPPVVAVMGHVDHGKTSLLDKIRTANTADKEAGGITQHISAYQIEKDGRKVTFLDTPGHEAFAALREHGAQLTDLAVIVVAADDGIKPQTLEAIRFAKKANVQILIAINKMDKEGANPNLIKQQLSEQNLLVEEWGGDIVVVEVSAKTGLGIDKLIEMILLVADVKELVADVEVPGEGLVIESHMEKGRGPIATALVQQGTLKSGDYIVAGSTYAKVKVLESTTGTTLKTAGPSSPVIIGGFKELPEFGDSFMVVKDEKTAKSQSLGNEAKSTTSSDMTNSELIRIMNRRNAVTELNVIVKADVQGSLTSVIDSIKAYDTDEVSVRIVGSGVGHITENDVHMAATTGAILYGFHVDLPASVRNLALRDKVMVRQYKIIYELLDDAKSELSALLAPEVIETELGRLVVKGIFNTTKTSVICGGEVTKGTLSAPSLARIVRDKVVLSVEVEVTALKQGPQETKEVQLGEMCGMSLKTKDKLDLQIGDHIETFSRETKERSL